MKLGKWYVPVALGVILGLVAGSIVSYIGPTSTTEGSRRFPELLSLPARRMNIICLPREGIRDRCM